MLLSLTSLLPLLLAPQQETTPPASQEKAPDAGEIELTFLANDGFLIRAGEFKVLIDGFLQDPFSNYEGLPPATARKMSQGEPPFDGPILALVSHVHGDHFQVRPAEPFLRNNPMAAMLSSPQVVNKLKKKATDFEAIKTKVRPLPVRYGESVVIEEHGIMIEFFRLRHGGDDRNMSVQNLAHLITVSGFKVLHVGDALPTEQVFAPLELKEKEIDIAIVPFWYFTVEEGVRIVDELIGATHLIAGHIPPRQREKVVAKMKEDNPHVIVFRESGEKKIFFRGEEEE